MSDEIRLEGLGVAPGVLDTIVTVAAEGVEGVAASARPASPDSCRRARARAPRARSTCASPRTAL